MAFTLRPDVTGRVDDTPMRQAFELALRGRGRTAPNPPVGAVVVTDGRVVGTGFHPQAGQPHAEIFALAEAGGSARGGALYVTLEPCAHHGRTPPCTDAIRAAGIARVVIGITDPTEAGGGAAALRSAGITVEESPDPDAFEWLVEGWLTRTRTGRPFVRAKSGLSLDARPSLEAGQRSAVTGDAGAAVTRELRATHDAVVVGAATVIVDDPALTVRDERGTAAEHQPLRVVLVRDRVPSADARVFSDGLAPTLVIASDTTASESLARLPDDVLVVRTPAAGGLGAALDALAARGLNEVLFEPGPALLTLLWRQRLIGEYVTVTAGGMAGPEAPDIYRGPPDREGDELVHAAIPVFAGVFEDVVVASWRPRSGSGPTTG